MAPDAPLTLDQFLDYLDIGEYDDSLEDIRVRVEERRGTLTERKVRTLAPGDTVVFNSHASPKYLQGLTATYKGPGNKSKKGNPRALLETPDDPRYKRYGNSSQIQAPINIIDKKVDP